MLSAASTSYDASSSPGSMAFLQLMARDASLLDELQRNPVEVLEKHGLYLDEKDLPSNVSLPAVDDLQSAVIRCSDVGSTSFEYAGFFGGFGD